MIHPTAIVSPEAEVGDNVEIGPYAIINGKVKIGRGTRVESYVCIGMGLGSVLIGEDNHFFPGSVIGGTPQDLSYKGEETCLVLGSGNTIREYVTINLGTVKGGGTTRVGDNNLIMAYVHIAHDCEIGNRVVIANASHFAGHVTVENKVTISGGCLLTQFIRLGQLCYVTGDSLVNKDVLPFSIAQGSHALMKATNKIGLERAQFPRNEIDLIHKALRYLIKGKGTVEEALERIHKDCLPSENIDYIINFVKNSKKGLAK